MTLQIAIIEISSMIKNKKIKKKKKRKREIKVILTKNKIDKP
jgi:hypothetical protein